MRVLFFMNVLGGGGAEMHFVRLAQELVQQGITPIYATLRGGGAYEELLPAGIEHRVLGDDGGSTIAALVRAMPRLTRLIDEVRPDIVFPVLSLTSLAGIVAARRARTRPRIVLGIQNALGKQVYERSSPVARLQRFLIPRLWPKVDRIVALSRGVADDIAAHVPACADRIEVIHNAGKPLEAEIERLGAIRPERPAGRPLLIAIGRLTEQKDYPTMFEALRRVQHTPEPVLWIMGSGELEAELKALAKEMGMEDRIVFQGFRRDVLAYAQVADVMVLSSAWEGFANVIVEAMAMGTPVIATDCEHGPGEIITDGENGRLVPVRAPAQLAAAIDEVLADPAMRRRLGEAGRQRSDAFGPEAIGRRYADALKRIAQSPAPRPVAGTAD